MSNSINYSDGVYINNVYNYILNKDFSDVEREEFCKNIARVIEKIYNKANGYWRLPKGKEQYISALQSIITQLKSNCNKKAIHEFQTELKSKIRDKCRLVFLIQERMCWPSFESVYLAAVNTNCFEAKLVYLPFQHINKTGVDNNLIEYQKDGLPVLSHEEYNLSEDNPDIVFIAKPYKNIPPQYYIDEIEKIVEHTIYIPYGMEVTTDLVRYGFLYYTHYRVWKHIAYGDIVKRVGSLYGYRNGINISVWGHPRADSYHADKHYEVPVQWSQKIQGKKVILWCPHHTIKSGSECISTWLEYNNDILNFFKKHKEIVLLWRPHPLLFGAIVNHKFMTSDELENLLADYKSQDNIILDEYQDYRPAFYISDAIITDGSTFSIEYLYTGKPLMVTVKNIEQFYFSQDMKSSLYLAKSSYDIIGFINMVINNEDPLRNARLLFKEKIFFIPKECTTGQYILTEILNELSSISII